ncbi:hypothetical protein Scep_004332 [Stephania cephalantha]|uniref:Uncharacterized protein n=1 Tax=Stephania cephalantha TaxID=152367 RepID=A0AAP0KTQ8_9MAGN
METGGGTVLYIKAKEGDPQTEWLFNGGLDMRRWGLRSAGPQITKESHSVLGVRLDVDNPAPELEAVEDVKFKGEQRALKALAHGESKALILSNEWALGEIASSESIKSEMGPNNLPAPYITRHDVRNRWIEFQNSPSSAVASTIPSTNNDSYSVLVFNLHSIPISTSDLSSCSTLTLIINGIRDGNNEFRL